MMNHSSLIGRLTKDVDLKYTPQGKAVGTFTLAVNRNFKNASGEIEADFLMCQIWEKRAENFANFTRKGSLVGIEGRIQTRNYENNQGQRVYVTEIIVSDFTLLESKNDSQGARNNGQSGQRNTQSNQGGYGGNNQSSDPFSSHGQSIDISDDDLPF